MIDFDLTTAEILDMGWEDLGPKKLAPRLRALNELPAVKEYFVYLATWKKAKPSKKTAVEANEIAA